MKLQTITVFNDIQERLEALTDSDFEWADRFLNDEPGASDKTLGVVEARATRALWVLSYRLKAQGDLFDSLSRAETTKEIAEDHARNATIALDLGDAVRELFWAQAKLDVGYYVRGNVSLRKGFTVVELPSTGSSLFGSVFGAGRTTP